MTRKEFELEYSKYNIKQFEENCYFEEPRCESCTEKLYEADTVYYIKGASMNINSDYLYLCEECYNELKGEYDE